MKSLTPILLSTLTLLTTTSAQSTPLSRAETALDVLQSWYNTSSGIWDTCGWWNGANCMTVLADLALIDDSSDSVQETAREVFNNTYYVGPKSNPLPFGRLEPNATATPSVTISSSGVASSTAATPTKTDGAYEVGWKWIDGSYDDDGWWALAWIAAYDLMEEQKYLDVAIGIYEHLNSTKKASCGNTGIYSDITNVYVNAVTNELFLSIAAHLANRAPNKQKYRQDAENLWNWFSTAGFINDNGTINDGLTDDCKNNGQTEWTYNQGIILGALVELHTTNKNNTYLTSATHIAKAAIKTFTNSTSNVIQESCDPDSCDANSTQFKGIFIRNLAVLNAVAPDDDYEKVIKASAESIWRKDRNLENDELGEAWTGPVNLVDASTHSSALDALVAAVGL
ncbi:putative glycosyl hydrolase [Aspergillus glaucus CBS 516.65]|uniref:Uncharacterized protein n=1 Tax=Aspergillus glaucus CBS 516.65 TaxID=1160497 RepID=A0A1L9VWB1_ASPGL|nr:hypothetical protein ASPGLDRAFT_43315 [Aspergillus glaucus CBS 516.65]OJJ88177.1 hypothetical protein ASPGLDRAFT_43315 [Aspergillus glaucus CBS 516.65]